MAVLSPEAQCGGCCQSFDYRSNDLCVGDLRWLSRGVARYACTAYATDGSDECYLRHHHRRRHVGGSADRNLDGKLLGSIAVALAAVNVFGGFMVTRRMLEMYQKKSPRAPLLRTRRTRKLLKEHEPMSMNLVVLLYLVASVFFIQSLKGCVNPNQDSGSRQLVWYDRNGDRCGHDGSVDLETQASGQWIVVGVGRP